MAETEIVKDRLGNQWTKKPEKAEQFTDDKGRSFCRDSLERVWQHDTENGWWRQVTAFTSSMFQRFFADKLVYPTAPKDELPEDLREQCEKTEAEKEAEEAVEAARAHYDEVCLEQFKLNKKLADAKGNVGVDGQRVGGDEELRKHKDVLEAEMHARLIAARDDLQEKQARLTELQQERQTRSQRIFAEHSRERGREAQRQQKQQRAEARKSIRNKLHKIVGKG